MARNASLILIQMPTRSRRTRSRIFSNLLLVLFILARVAQADPPRHWQPIRDDVYLQEVGRQFAFPEPLTAVAFWQNHVFTGSAKGIQRLQGDQLVADQGLTKPVRRLMGAGGSLWAMTALGLYRLGPAGWTNISPELVIDVCEHRGEIVVATVRKLWRVQGETLQPMSKRDAPFEIRRLVSHQESLFLLGRGRLTTYAASRFGGLDAYGFEADQTWDWGALPSPETRDATSARGSLILATDRGLALLRGMSLAQIRGEQGLPFEDTICLSPGFTNDVWIGTSRGAIRWVGEGFQYFAGRRWLPNDQVNALGVGPGTVYLATDHGLGIIQYKPFTLAKKAAYYERHLEAWGQKRLGLVHKLEWDDAAKQFVREAGDNDGGYSSYYLAAESYRYAVTHESLARQEATNTFHALRWLEHLTGIPGFPARSVWVKGELGHKSTGGSGGYPAEWHTAADGRFEWKGDTSSDELCAHFYAVTLFLEMAAQGREVDQGKTHLARIASHLIDHGWQLVDLDGKPTRWGRWDPEYFQTDEGRYDRGLQAVELLSFIRTAESLTGDPKFSKAYHELVQLGYPAYTLRARNTFPPDSVLHFLDELSFWCWWNLLRHETDPDLHALYRRGYERSYEAVRLEHNPWFNFVYGALTGQDCETGEAVARLREWPLDLRTWSYQNSQRTDLHTPPGYVALKGGIRPFSPRESEPLRWDHWTMQLDGGTDGRDVVEPASWLLAYWMGRYYGFIEAPTSTDPALLTVSTNAVPVGGAAAYNGPARPAF
jgi:hypothetical protein